MKHTLHVIGYLGGKTCYLDIPLEEAKRRYEKSEETSINGEFIDVKTFEFEDEFWAYDVWFFEKTT